jgi:hypothetical protein
MGGPGADRLTMNTAVSRLLGIQEPLRWFAASLRRSFRFRVQDHGPPHSLDECGVGGDRGGSRLSIRGGVQPRQCLTNRNCSRSGPEGTDQHWRRRSPATIQAGMASLRGRIGELVTDGERTTPTSTVATFNVRSTSIAGVQLTTTVGAVFTKAGAPTTSRLAADAKAVLHGEGRRRAFKSRSQSNKVAGV